MSLVHRHTADPKYSGVPKINYELPDGTVVAAGLERFQVPEILMNPEAALSLLPLDDSSVESEWSRESVPKMVAESIFRCEREQVCSRSLTRDVGVPIRPVFFQYMHVSPVCPSFASNCNSSIM